LNAQNRELFSKEEIQGPDKLSCSGSSATLHSKIKQSKDMPLVNTKPWISPFERIKSAKPDFVGGKK
jgi:hypothetical protein